MFKIIKNDILLPEINNTFNWYLGEFRSKTKLITHIDTDDISKLNIKQKHPHLTHQKPGAVWSTSSHNNFLDYMRSLEKLGSTPIVSLDHVIWFTENKTHLLNTEEKNSNNQYIGNFFFIPKNEFMINKGTWTGEIVVASVMRRNSTPTLEFGMRFYDINDPKIWKAKDRRIISLS